MAVSTGEGVWPPPWTTGASSPDGRSCTWLDEFATLVEAAIDVHWRTLAAALGVTVAGDASTAAEAALLQDQLHKGG